MLSHTSLAPLGDGGLEKKIGAYAEYAEAENAVNSVRTARLQNWGTDAKTGGLGFKKERVAWGCRR